MTSQLPKKANEPLYLEAGVLYAYGWPAEPEKNNPSRSLLSIRVGALCADLRITPEEARALAAMLCAAADLAEGQKYRAEYWHGAITQIRNLDTLIADAQEQIK